MGHLHNFAAQNQVQVQKASGPAPYKTESTILPQSNIHQIQKHVPVATIQMLIFVSILFFCPPERTNPSARSSDYCSRKLWEGALPGPLQQWKGFRLGS